MHFQRRNFKGSSAHAVKPAVVKNDAETNKASDDLLESILGTDEDDAPRSSR